MSRADRPGLIAHLRLAGILSRAQILEEPHGFRLRPITLNGNQARSVRAALTRVAARYSNVCVGNAALLSLPQGE
jgi:hypothetical protein